MKIAAIQMRSGLDPEANLAALEPMLAEAAAAGAHSVLTPEVTMIFPENRDQLRSVAAPPSRLSPKKLSSKKRSSERDRSDRLRFTGTRNMVNSLERLTLLGWVREQHPMNPS